VLPVVLLSHRGPASFRRTPSGLTAKRGAGGLVTALMGLAEHLDEAVWVCAAATEADAAVAAEHEGHPVEIAFAPEPQLVDADTSVDLPTLNVRLVDVDRDRHDMFYGQIANPLLWFVQHELYGLATQPDVTAVTHHAFAEGYVAVNEQFADAVVEEVQSRGGRAIVLLQDYHFYLVGDLVRRRCPDAIISHFVHIPWPGPDAWRVLPTDMRERLLRGLLGCDVVAFHTTRFARNFLACAQELLGLDVDLHAGTIDLGDRTVMARAYPISVDVDAVEKLAASEEVAARRATLADTLLVDDRQLVVRVDRTDPSKNIVRGFRAYELYLEAHPDAHGRVGMLALLDPSRQDIPEYSEYVAAIQREARRVNDRFQRGGWMPAEVRVEDNFPAAVAAYKQFDVLFVNAIFDGMNLVSKEAPLVNERDGVVVLSENTGAYEELQDWVVRVNPFDVAGQAEALSRALAMSQAERHERLAAIRAHVREHDIAGWIEGQLADLDRCVASAAPR